MAAVGLPETNVWIFVWVGPGSKGCVVYLFLVLLVSNLLVHEQVVTRGWGRATCGAAILGS